MQIEDAKTSNRTLVRQAVLDCASQILAEEGPQALSMRKLSQKLGASTIVLYTYFKDKPEILNELYLEGFERLRADLKAVPSGTDAMEYVMQLGRAYRKSAVRNPTYYQIMFSRCVPGFTPPLASLQKSKASFEILVNGVQRCIDAQLVVPGDAREIAEVLWGTLHGIISLELFGYLGPSRMGEARLEQAIQTIKAGLTRHIA